MGYCENCNEYHKKHPAGKICKKCWNELCNTPPSINSFEAQYARSMKARNEREVISKKYYASASLLDLAALKVLQNSTTLNFLINNLPEGHPPWYSLLKAWYFVKKNKIISGSKPKAKLTNLLNSLDANILSFHPEVCDRPS